MYRQRSRNGISTPALAVVVIVIVAIAAVAVVEGFGLGRTSTSAGQTGTTSSTQLTTSSTLSSTQSSATTTSTTSTSTGSSILTTTTTSTSSSSSPATGAAIDVRAVFSNGTVIPGVYTELANSAGEVGTGYTPVTFSVDQGVNYSVIVSDSVNHYFNHWSDGFTSRVIPIQANGSTTTLEAVFTATPESPPPTAYSITVTSSDLNGTAISGYLMDVRVDGYAIVSGYTPVTFTSLEPGIQYQVVAYWAGNYYFRNFGGGNLNRYALVTFNSTGSTTVSLNAQYQYVPKSEAASLNIIAELPNGTVLGTTFNNSDYIQHTPGLWLTITPPGATGPFTGTYTGGSILPFVLIGGETYTVQMTLGYGNLQFAYWKDTGSISASRSVFLNENTTLIAVYEET